MDEDFDDLNDTWKFVRQNALAKHRKGKQKPESINLDERKVFVNPENWLRGVGVALIHEETQTLLGNFIEYTHRFIPSARKLVREDGPLSVSRSESVSGSWWVEPSALPKRVESWDQQRFVVLHLHLGELGLHSPAVALNVCLSAGGIARALLAEDTTFSQLEGAEQLVLLPAGTDILPCMSKDCKVRLRMEVGI